MGWLGVLASVIASAVASAAVAVATVIATIVYAIGSVIAYVLYGVYTIAASSILGSIAGLGLINSGTGAMLLSNIGALTTMSASLYVHTISFVSAIVAGFKSFLEIIHFKTLLSIHNITYLVSEDYREYVNKAWYQIAKYSKALELGAGFIPLALNNARTVVLDASSMMGRSYDLSQVTWLSELGVWATNVSDVGKRYKNEPGLVFEDIAQWIEKPYVDAKASTVQNMILTIEKGIEATEEVVYDVAKLSDDLNEFTEALPYNVQKYIKPYVEEFRSRIDEFVYDEFAEYRKTMTQITDILVGENAKNKSKLDDLAHQMLYPGDMIEGVNNLPPTQREEQVKKINNVVTEPYTYDEAERDIETEEAMTELERINDLIQSEISKAIWEYSESGIILESEDGDIEDRESWYVGDY